MSKKNKREKKPAVGSPAAGSNNKRDKKQSLEDKIKAKKKVVIGIAVAVAVALAAVVAFAFPLISVSGEIRNADFKGRLEPESVAVKSSFSLSQQQKLAKSVKSRGSINAFDFYVNEEITIDEHTDPALLELGSVESNECILIAFLLDEKGETLYRSLGIEPGEEIRSVKFFDSVSYGTHDATLVVNGYDAETYKKVGTQTVKIQLKIGVDEVEE